MLMLLLFATGLFAGTVDAIAGGGGLISLPVLLSLGMPPHIAFGTNKLQGTIGTLMAARRYYRLGWISLEKIYIGIIFGLVGSVSGAVMSQVLSSDILKKIIPVLLFFILIYTIRSPRLGKEDIHPRMSEFWFFILFGFGLGFYDGFFGPGTGSFWVFLLSFCLGYNLIKATAYTKMFNLNSSLIATICFAVGGNIDYRVGLVMAAGQWIGGRLGANLAIRKGVGLIRPLFLCVVSVTTISLLYKGYANADILIHFAKTNSVAPKILMASSVTMLLVLVSIKLFRHFKSQEESIDVI